MKRLNTQGIILARTDYGEADRILTLLTPDQGKLKAIAKGVRKSKSKLAGGIELFSVSEISVIVGRSEINTLISTRLIKHYGDIVKDLDRTNCGYELIKMLNKATEDQPEEAYFSLLTQAFESLDDSGVSTQLIDIWFRAQLLKLSGHSPNLQTEKTGAKLQAGRKYDFDFETMSFRHGGSFSTDQIKYLRLLFSGNPLSIINKVNDSSKLIGKVAPLVRTVQQTYIRG
jgi:DNA repair protein RecO (recombination protein O)